MDYISIIILGFIQGITEFLPISSTGHLVLMNSFFQFFNNLAFDAFIHLGSFCAILIYFWKDLKKIWNYKALIFISALPGAIAGLTLEHLIESYFRTSFSVAFFLIFMSLPMFLGERFGKKTLYIENLDYKRALLIGLFQSLALLPGTSRSGITISAGLLLGLKREEAARFSFLAGAPLILGAGLYEGMKLFKNPTFSVDYIMTGFLSSALFSFLAIAFLIPFLKRHTLYIFITYRMLLAIIILGVHYLKSF
ncbi:MAG: undecaprenyl-diphosphate phosphatase [Caldimicrobium sp.]